MLGVSLLSFLTPSSSHHPPPSQPPARNLATQLDHALRRAPAEARPELEELCNRMICCQHLWPASSKTPGDAEPFSLHVANQSPRFHHERAENTISALLGKIDVDLLADINSYVLQNGDRHWQALLAQEYPGALIDPKETPRHWPRKCLEWAIRALDMREADLSWANLSGLDMRGVDLRRTGLQYACMDRADMRGAQFANADIEGATFRGANLDAANLDGVTLSTNKNNFDGANMDGVSLMDISLDIHAYEYGADRRFALREGLLPPTLDLYVREQLNDDIKKELGGLAVKYLHRFLPHVEMSASFCLECLQLSRAEDRMTLLQMLLRYGTAPNKVPVKNNESVESIYEALQIAIEDQFLVYLDKQNLGSLRMILGHICENYLAYLNSMPQQDPWRKYRTASARKCMEIEFDATKICVKDLTLSLLRREKTARKQFDAVRRSLTHLGNANPGQAFRMLMHDLTPKQLYCLIQRDIDSAACYPLEIENEENCDPDTSASDEEIPDAPSIPERNTRRLIDLLHENLPPDMRGEIHTLLQDETGELEESRRLVEGDCDYLDSYTASDIDEADAAGDGLAANVHADQKTASGDAPDTPAPAWKSAFFASLLLPVSYFFQQ